MNFTDKEIQFTDKHFQFLRKKVMSLAGIHLSDTKDALVYSRLSRLLRLHHLESFDEYCESLNCNNPKFEAEFVNAITTNYTSFMRENHHFEHLQKIILPELLQRNVDTKRIRIWSAGCSSGEEAYSISFVVADVCQGYQHWDIKILATDIDSDALKKAECGLFEKELIRQLPASYFINKDRYFKLKDNTKETYEVRNKFRNMISFKNFNLMTQEPWPMHGPFDVIFCRNVMIYFDRESQLKTMNSFISLLKLNGYLILGHSESAPSILHTKLKYWDKTIYRRVQ